MLRKGRTMTNEYGDLENLAAVARGDDGHITGRGFVGSQNLSVNTPELSSLRTATPEERLEYVTTGCNELRSRITKLWGQAREENYDDIVDLIISARCRPDSALVNSLKLNISESDFNKIIALVRKRAEEAQVSPNSLAVQLDNGERVLFEGDSGWINKWCPSTPTPETPEEIKGQSLIREMLDKMPLKMASDLGSRKFLGKTLSEHLVVGVGKKAVKELSFQMLYWAGIGGAAGASGVGGGNMLYVAGIGALASVAGEILHQRIRTGGKVIDEYNKDAENNESLRTRKERIKAELRALKPQNRKKLVFAAAIGAIGGVVGRWGASFVSDFIEEKGITLDFLTSRLPNISMPEQLVGAVGFAGDTWKGVSERFGGVAKSVEEQPKESPAYQDMQQENAGLRENLTKVNENTTTLLKNAAAVHEAAEAGRGIVIDGVEYPASEVASAEKLLTDMTRPLEVGSGGTFDPTDLSPSGDDITGGEGGSGGLGPEDGAAEPGSSGSEGASGGPSEAVGGSPDKVFEAAGIGEYIELKAGSNPWNESEKILTKIMGQMDLGKPTPEMVHQFNIEFCKANGIAPGVGMPGRDARFLMPGEKLKVTKDLKDLAVGLVKKAA